jgi:F-type H+-transporting ATPase subunit gamma
MANLRDIRIRIRGVRNTGKITRAMQLVASSKMKRAQDRAVDGRPYAMAMARMLTALNDSTGKLQHPFLAVRTVRTRGILLLSTDRGLCGPLNANLFREAAAPDKANTAYVTIGRKGRQFISRTGRRLLADFPVSEATRFSELRPAVEFLIKAFIEGEIDTVEVLYPRFRNTLIQVPTLLPVLPLTDFRAAVRALAASGERALPEDARDFLFEPDAATILGALLDLFIKRQIFHLLLETRASEHSARMVAMKAATDNAQKLADRLNLQYNKARQAGITQELLEITAATSHS